MNKATNQIFVLLITSTAISYSVLHQVSSVYILHKFICLSTTLKTLHEECPRLYFTRRLIINGISIFALRITFEDAIILSKMNKNIRFNKCLNPFKIYAVNGGVLCVVQRRILSCLGYVAFHDAVDMIDELQCMRKEVELNYFR
jgi:hypothetical protein